LKKDTYSESGYKVYGQEQVIRGDIALGDYYIPLSKFAEMQVFEIQEGDVLLSLVGTIGKVLVVPAEFEKGIINPRLLRLRPNEETVLSSFFKFMLLIDTSLRQINGLSGGGTMPVINGGVIKRILTPIIGLPEQKQIMGFLAQIEKKSDQLVVELTKLRQQKQGLMQDLLTGKVRV
jgi:type I restriction enzyme S subunit